MFVYIVPAAHKELKPDRSLSLFLIHIFSESKDPDAYLANPLSCYVGNSDNALWNFLEDAFMNDEIEDVIIDLIAPLAAEIIYSLLVPEQLFKPVRTIRGLLRGAHSFASFHDILRLIISLFLRRSSE